MSESPATHNRIFYGWYVAFAIMLVLSTGSGLAFYNLSVLLDAFVRERGFPVSIASFATASFFVATAVAGVISGTLITRIDARVVMIAAAAVGAAALASLRFVSEPWQLYAFHVVFGLCYGGCGLVPTTTIVARWFTARRPLAMSIASLGLSLGGIIFTPIVALLINRLGVAGAAPFIGMMFLIGIVPVTALVIRPSPQAMGLEPDGAPRRQASAAAPAGQSPGVSFSEARRSRFFYAVAVAYTFASGGQVGAIVHLYRLANERVGLEVAALALSLLAGASVTGRILGGGILQKVNVRTFAPVIMGLQAIALAFLAAAYSPETFLTAVALFGLTIGNVLIMQSLLLADAFGARDYSRIFSISQLITMVGVAGGPALMGAIYEKGGGYAAAYSIAAFSSVLGGFIVMMGGKTHPTGKGH